ncbi:MAG: hypothetical protein ACOY5Y_12820 [Pseudomonadota bacterium]
MARMPRGEPRTVPDPAGDAYDREMARERARREARPTRQASPIDLAREAFEDFQNGPDITRPTTAQSFIPVVGPAWEAVADLQDGDYGGAAFNTAMAVADVLPVGVGVKGFRVLSKGVGVLKKGSVTANAARKSLRAKGLARPGEEIHHTVPLNGTPRNVQDWRNNYAVLKVLPKEQHRRLTGSWQGKPRYDPVRRIWIGTTDWQKAIPTGLAGYAVDGIENLSGRKK